MPERTLPEANEHDIAAAKRMVDADNAVELVAAVVAELRRENDDA
jgi:hypothetical protein